MPSAKSPTLAGRRLWTLALAGCLLGLGLATGCSSETTQGTVVKTDTGLFGNGDTAIGEEVAVFPGGDAIASDGQVSDIAIAPGEFGYKCALNNECNSGLCVDSPDGKICTKYCTEACPKGFACIEEVIPGTTDKGYYCSPKFKYVCDPCGGNDSCNDQGQAGAICLKLKTNAGNLGGFCGAKCNPQNPDCPGGFDCQSWTDEETGLSTYQCMRVDGADCNCSGHAQQLGLKTECSRKNVYGSCNGWRQCTETGLSACTAKAAKPEECNGVDDDCNGKTDDFQAGASCDIKNEFGTCKGQVKECVDGNPVCEGKPAAPEACNGVDDNCDGKTDEGLCEDGDPCTSDKCNTDGSCQHIQLGGLPCDDGSICTAVDKCVSGKCFGGGELDCDDKDACTSDSCNPIDGCQHKPASDAVCPDDGIECTQDLCKDGKCQHPQASDGTKCSEDGKPCTADICQTGKCQHPIQEGNPCVDDGKACTSDLCVAGVCQHTPASGIPCDDGKICTEGDVCLSGACKAGKLNLCDDGQPCTKDACIEGAGCSHDPQGANGYSCTAASADCPAGQCVGGTCLSVPSKLCFYEYDPGICGDPVQLPGYCASSGKCTPDKNAAQQAQNKVTCTIPCKSVCVACSLGGIPLQLCLDGLFGF
jgi:hypothetical protein